MKYFNADKEPSAQPVGGLMLITFQDFEQASDKMDFVRMAISTYQQTDEYKMALLADEYDGQRNVTIREAARVIFSVSGVKREDYTASNNRIASNFFNRLNTQRCLFSLGNGISFIDPKEAMSGKPDTTKEKLGKRFDHVIKEAGYHALIHGRSYLFWDGSDAYEFEMTEFVPLEDENDGSLRAGIRFWQLDRSKPMNAVLYEADGYTKYRSNKEGGLEEVQKKRAYKLTYHYTDAGDIVSIDEDNYIKLPIVRVFASRLKQSTLVGMRDAIDAYDLIKSGFANDLTDCAQIYWIVENYGGMTDADLAQFLDRLKLNHVANADTQSGGRITPYTQDVPYNARQTLLAELRHGLYEDFGALDVHVISAGATNDHIDAAYQPLNENAADFEKWIGDAIEQLLELQGIDDSPVFKREMISNKNEQVSMLVQEAAWLDEGTIIRKLPNLSPDEIQAVLESKKETDMARMLTGQALVQQPQAPQQVQP